MNTKIRFQLSAMMFLQYLIWGAWYVTVGTYLGTNLKFTGIEIGWVYTTPAIAAMISPFFVGMIADRFFATERILAFLHILGGCILWYVSSLTSFKFFFPVLLCYTLCYMPTLALTNSLSFHQMKDIGKEFPGIKVLAGIGWIVAGWIVGGMKVEAEATPMKVAAIASGMMGLYCLTLPHTPPKQTGAPVTLSGILGLDALKLFRQPGFAVFVIGSFLFCIPLTCYFVFANMFFNEMGMQNAAAKMTLAQVSDSVCFLFMPFLFRRLGVKKLLLLGMLAWAVRYFLMAIGGSEHMWMLYLAIIVHGICYDFFFVTGQIYTDQQADVKIRGAAQGLIAFVTLGAGMFAGSLLAGKIFDRFTHGNVHDWRQIWILWAVVSAVLLTLFAIFFREAKKMAAPVTAGTEKAGNLTNVG